jgi:hypothetical protein
MRSTVVIENATGAQVMGISDETALRVGAAGPAGARVFSFNIGAHILRYTVWPTAADVDNRENADHSNETPTDAETTSRHSDIYDGG